MTTSLMLTTDTRHGLETNNARVVAHSRGSSKCHHSDTWLSSKRLINC
ncbi:hypothetical protein SynWH8103_00478 [Synechococcus sp. WH 8103]|nr:hypothetical protein SynWH8103_00478 [Synechococcus sp. WH 8103]